MEFLQTFGATLKPNCRIDANVIMIGNIVAYGSSFVNKQTEEKKTELKRLNFLRTMIEFI